MILMSSTKMVVQELMQTAHSAETPQNGSSMRLQGLDETNHLSESSPTIGPKNNVAQFGTSPFCTCRQSTSAARLYVCMETITRSRHSQKHKEERDGSEDKPHVERAKIAYSTGTDNGYEAGDESTYEPEPKRRKILRYAICDAKTACDTDDDEEDGDDESFVGIGDISGSQDDHSSMDKDDGSTLSCVTSSAPWPISSRRGHFSSTRNTTTLQSAYIACKRVRQCSIAATDIPRLGREPRSSQFLLPVEPQVKQHGRHKRATRFTIYEDDTATIGELVGGGLRNSGWMPAIDHRVFAALDQGQENRPPAHERVVGAGFEIENVLREEDEQEEMITMESLVVSDGWA